MGRARMLAPPLDLELLAGAVLGLAAAEVDDQADDDDREGDAVQPVRPGVEYAQTDQQREEVAAEEREVVERRRGGPEQQRSSAVQ
jgi:hypothetical protein